MTTPTAVSPTARHKITFSHVLRSEWIKLTTLRSTWLAAAATLVVIVGFGALAALVASGEITTPNGPGAAQSGGAAGGPLDTVLVGANLALLVVAVLGSVVGAREFSTGMIRTTLSAVPTRLPTLWGKLISFIVVVAPTVLLGVLTAFFLGMTLLDADGAATVAWTDDGVARAVLGTAGYILGIGAIGLALGILLRSTAAAIGTVLGAVLFVPALASALLPDSWDEVLKYLPSNAATAFTTTASTDTVLSPGVGAVVFTAWIVLAIGVAAWALVRWDA